MFIDVNRSCEHIIFEVILDFITSAQFKRFCIRIAEQSSVNFVCQRTITTVIDIESEYILHSGFKLHNEIIFAGGAFRMEKSYVKLNIFICEIYVLKSG